MRPFAIAPQIVCPLPPTLTARRPYPPTPSQDKRYPYPLQRALVHARPSSTLFPQEPQPRHGQSSASSSPLGGASRRYRALASWSRSRVLPVASRHGATADNRRRGIPRQRSPRVGTWRHDEPHQCCVAQSVRSRRSASTCSYW